MERFTPKGIITPMVIPMTMESSVNEAALRELVRFLADNGVDGLFPVMTTGDYLDISPEDYRAIFDIIKDETSGSIPLYAGTSGVTSSAVISFARMAEDIGATALIAITPSLFSANQNTLFSHFEQVAQNTCLPVIIYNRNTKDNALVTPYTAQKLSRIKNISGICDCFDRMDSIDEYLRLTKGTGFSVLIDSNSLVYGGLCYGAEGSLVSCSHIAPRLAADVYDKYVSSDTDGSIEAQSKITRLKNVFKLGSFPSVIKECLREMDIPFWQAYTCDELTSHTVLDDIRDVLIKTGIIEIIPEEELSAVEV